MQSENEQDYLVDAMLRADAALERALTYHAEEHTDESRDRLFAAWKRLNEVAATLDAALQRRARPS